MLSNEAKKVNNESIQLMLSQVLSDKLVSVFNIDPNSIIVSNLENPETPSIVCQFAYNERMNKVYVEYVLNNALTSKLCTGFSSLNDFYRETDYYITENFHFTMGFYCNIISHFLFGYHNDSMIDSSLVLGPYSVGYWKSVFDTYQFIQDEFTANICILEKKRQDPNDDTFSKLYDDIKALNKKYHYNGSIIGKYGCCINAHDKEFFDYYREHKNDKDALSDKIEELDKKYADIHNTYQSNIPNSMKEYNEIYNKYYGVKYEDLNSATKKFYLNIE